MKTIFVVLATPFYLDKGSSISARARIIALASSGHHVDVFTYPTGNNVDLKNVSINRCFAPFYKKISPGLSFSKICVDILLFIYCFICLLKKSKRYLLIVGEDCEGGFIGMVLSKIFKKPFIYEMYNPLHETLRPYKKLKKLLSFAKIYDNLLEKKSSNITVEWKYEEERIKKRFPAKNVRVIYDAFPNDYEEVDYLPKQPYIVYSGNFKNYQGVSLFLDVFQKYVKYNSDIRLLLVGGDFDDTKQYASKLSLNGFVIFTGRLSLIKTNYIIKNSLFCILPRTFDGPPGLKALHYFAQGKSILATNLSCNAKLINHKKTGILVEVNINAMYEGLKMMVQNGDLRKRLERNIIQLGIGSQDKINAIMDDFLSIIHKNI